MESCSGSHEPSRSGAGYKAVCYRHLLLPGAGDLMRKSVETSLSSCSALSQGLCRCLPAVHPNFPNDQFCPPLPQLVSLTNSSRILGKD